LACTHLVVDSATALPRHAAQELSLTVVTHTFVVGGRPFHGGDLFEAEFIDALRHADSAPIIDVPSADDCVEAYRRVLGWGVDVISIHPIGPFSGLAAASSAAAMLPDGAQLTVLESRWGSTALGLIVARAAHAGLDEWPRADVVRLIDAIDRRLRLVLVTGGVDYLQRMGTLELGEVAARPPDAEDRLICEARGGRIAPIAGAANLGDALRMLAAEVAARVEASGPVHMAVFGAGADAEAAAIATFLEARHQPVEMWLAPCDPVLAWQAGPGAFGVAFYSDDA